jgi:hypothetical protein
MARLTADDSETPKRPRIVIAWNPNPLPAAIALFLVLLGQVSVSASDPTVRMVAVLVALVIVFQAGSRFGRAEQARELLRGQP